MQTPKPAPKKLSAKLPARKAATASFAQEFAIIRRDVKNYLIDWAGQWEKFRDIVKNNYELGRRHLSLGNIKDAIFRFRFVLWLNPAHVDAMYYLGVSYMANGDKKHAAEYFKKALKLRPGYEEAAYLLAVMGSNNLPTRMPLVLAREYFDGIAGDYTTQQVDVLKYEGHIQLDGTIRSCLVPGRVDHLVLELGVGTGLCGAGIRDVAAHLTGIDISDAMLEQAKLLQDAQGRKTYDALIKREAVEFLKESPDNAFDIVFSAGMFSYLGDLRIVFEQSQRVLKEGGLFAFTADVLDGEGFRFDSTEARFRFSKSYLQQLAASFGYRELRLKDNAVYPDYAAWICVYQK